MNKISILVTEIMNQINNSYIRNTLMLLKYYVSNFDTISLKTNKTSGLIV